MSSMQVEIPLLVAVGDRFTREQPPPLQTMSKASVTVL